MILIKLLPLLGAAAMAATIAMIYALTSAFFTRRRHMAVIASVSFIAMMVLWSYFLYIITKPVFLLP